MRLGKIKIFVPDLEEAKRFYCAFGSGDQPHDGLVMLMLSGLLLLQLDPMRQRIPYAFARH